jgi:hypothetical protein
VLSTILMSVVVRGQTDAFANRVPKITGFLGALANETKMRFLDAALRYCTIIF